MLRNCIISTRTYRTSVPQASTKGGRGGSVRTISKYMQTKYSIVAFPVDYCTTKSKNRVLIHRQTYVWQENRVISLHAALCLFTDKGPGM